MNGIPPAKVLALVVLALAAGGCGEGPRDGGSGAASATASPAASASMLSATALPGLSAGPSALSAGATASGPANATPVALGEVVAGALASAGDVDWFVVRLDPASPCSVTLRSFGELRLSLVAPDARTTLAGGAPGVRSLEHRATAAGLHYLRVEAGAGQALHYTLEVAPVP